MNVELTGRRLRGRLGTVESLKLIRAADAPPNKSDLLVGCPREQGRGVEETQAARVMLVE